MSGCRMEDCPNWNGHGCIRGVLATCDEAITGPHESCRPIGERTFCGAEIDRHYLEDNNEWTLPVLNTAGQYVHPNDKETV